MRSGLSLQIPNLKLECQSALHNKDSPSVISLAMNWTTYIAALDQGGEPNFSEHYQNLTVIPKGVIVRILGTRCDGVPDCWNKTDENMCGFSELISVLIGNLFTVHTS